jgi:hypothetical protein
VYLSLDAGEPELLASNKGWSDFIDWVDGFDLDSEDELIHLCDHGWCQNLATLEEQLGDALEGATPSDETVRSTGKNLLEMLGKRGSTEVATVNNGMTSEEIGDSAEMSEDSSGHQHAPAGSPSGGQFTKGDVHHGASPDKNKGNKEKGAEKPSKSGDASTMVPKHEKPTIQHLHDAFDAIDKSKGSHNFVHLGALRTAFPQLDKAQFDALLRQARIEGTITLAGAEGRHGITDADKDAAVYEDPGSGRKEMLLYAMKRPKR